MDPAADRATMTAVARARSRQPANSQAGEETKAPGEMLREADRLAPVPAAVVAGRPSAAERAAAGSGGTPGMPATTSAGPTR